VHGLAGSHCFIYRRANSRVLKELAIADRFGHACEVLIHHSSGAEVHVADFRVAHLAVRQADFHPGTGDQAVGHGLVQTVEHRHFRGVDSVAFVAVAVTEAVQDNQNQRFRRGSHESDSWLKVKEKKRSTF